MCSGPSRGQGLAAGSAAGCIHPFACPRPGGAWGGPRPCRRSGGVNQDAARAAGDAVIAAWATVGITLQFTPVYHQGDPGSGIGGYDLRSPADRVFAFDYDGSGKLDHLALYRPGTGTIWILK